MTKSSGCILCFEQLPHRDSASKASGIPPSPIPFFGAEAPSLRSKSSPTAQHDFWPVVNHAGGTTSSPVLLRNGKALPSLFRPAQEERAALHIPPAPGITRQVRIRRTRGDRGRGICPTYSCTYHLRGNCSSFRRMHVPRCLHRRKN